MINLAYNCPAITINGDTAIVTKVRAQLYQKAINIPVISEEVFEIYTPIILEVNPFTILASEASLEARVPGLF